MGNSTVEMIFGTIGGLALFLFGMSQLSDGLKRIAGDGLRRLLEKITKWSLVAMLIGAGVTCLIQSSSATTVIVVGLVNAGLLTLKQAISVVLGANIGTTFTAWLMAGMGMLKVEYYALPAVALGFAMNVLAKRQKAKLLGQILLGFGILFIGIGFMKGAFEPLKESQKVRDVLIAIGDRPMLAVLAGTIITMLIQSSSASIAIIQFLAFTGAFGNEWDTVLRVTIPFILGDNIGTTITAQIAAVQTNLAGRRTAMAHTVFNFLGVLLVLPLVYTGWYVDMVKAIAPFALTEGTIMAYIAIAHSTFNVVAAFVMLPLVGVLEKVVIRLVPAGKRYAEPAPVTLERHLLDTPALAIQQATREIVRMARTARDALDLSVKAITTDDYGALSKVARKEDAVDNFQTEITRYLVELSQRELDSTTANELPVLMHTVNDLERVGDHATNIAEIAQRKIDQRHSFSDPAKEEIARMRTRLGEMIDNVIEAIDTADSAVAREALRHEDAINGMQMQFRHNHIDRMRHGQCDPMSGLIFIDFINNMEKIGDHLTNIAQGVIGHFQWSTPPPPQSSQEDEENTATNRDYPNRPES